MSKLEDIMKAEGWILGYSTNWNVKYWSFRKDNFEIELRDIHVVDPEIDKIDGGKHFKNWVEEQKVVKRRQDAPKQKNEVKEKKMNRDEQDKKVQEYNNGN